MVRLRILATVMHRKKVGVSPMLLALFFILLVLWVLGFLTFHVAGALIHLLLLLALISLVLHLFTRRAV